MWHTYKEEEGEGHELSQTGIVKAYRLRDQRPNFELNMRKQRLHGGSRTGTHVGRSRQMGSVPTSCKIPSLVTAAANQTRSRNARNGYR